jgi:hypothetical protein
VTEAFTIVNSQLSMVEALEAVQRAAFPTLAEDEIITAAHYAAHITRFPEGQFVVLNAAGQVVGSSCTLTQGRQPHTCDTQAHAFIWDSTHGLHDLQGMLD